MSAPPDRPEPLPDPERLWEPRADEASSALSDIGQLLRWVPPTAFTEAFAASYRADGGRLVDDWQRWAAAFDLVNLAGLLVNLGRAVEDGAGPTARVIDVQRRIEQTLSSLRC